MTLVELEARQLAGKSHPSSINSHTSGVRFHPIRIRDDWRKVRFVSELLAGSCLEFKQVMALLELQTRQLLPRGLQPPRPGRSSLQANRIFLKSLLIRVARDSYER